MIRSAVALARLAGPLLLFAFGSQLLVLELRSASSANIEERMRSSGAFTFVSLDRAQQRRTFFGETQYYYAYSGTYRNISLETVEEVSPQFFHLHSEGKNVQAIVYVDESGTPYTHLRGNSAPPMKDLSKLRDFSAFFAIIGLALTAFGWGIGSLLRN